MQTKNLIQAAANVVKITRLSKGDVIKMIEKEYSGNDIYYGVVIDLLNDGTTAYVQIMRYKQSYGDIKCDIKTYKGDTDLSIFPATVEEVEEYLNDTIKRMQSDIDTKQKELNEKKEGLQKARDFVSMETSKKLTAVSFKEIPQAEFNQLQIESQQSAF